MWSHETIKLLIHMYVTKGVQQLALKQYIYTCLHVSLSKYRCINDMYKVTFVCVLLIYSFFKI